MNEYYSIVPSFSALMSGRKVQKVSPKKSIHQHIYLILMTALGCNRFEPNYGCKIWEKDFDISTNENNWISEMSNNIYLAIATSEPRVYPSFKVEVKAKEVEQFFSEEHAVNFIKYFEVEISNLKLKATNEVIDSFQCSIAFSPVTLE